MVRYTLFRYRFIGHSPRTGENALICPAQADLKPLGILEAEARKGVCRALDPEEAVRLQAGALVSKVLGEQYFRAARVGQLLIIEKK